MTTSSIPYIKFETQISTKYQPYLLEHRVQGKIIFPLTGYIEMALAAATEVFGTVQPIAENIELKEALILAERETRNIKFIICSQISTETATFEILSQRSDNEELLNQWTLHVKGELRNKTNDTNSFISASSIFLADIKQRCSEIIPSFAFYQSLRSRGMEHGPSFQGIQQIYCGIGEALGQIYLPSMLAEEASFYHIHPAFLDACIQVLVAALPSNSSQFSSFATYLPYCLEKVCIHKPVSTQVWSYVNIRSNNLDTNPDIFECDFYLVDDLGEIFVEILGLGLQRFDKIEHDKSIIPYYLKNWLYQLQWQPKIVEQTIKPLISNYAGKWLIFVESDKNLGKELVALFQSSNHSYIVVSPGSSYSISSDKTQAWIDPENFEDYQKLLHYVGSDHQIPCRGIIHLWSLNTELANNNINTLDTSQKLGYQSILLLLQSLNSITWSETPKIWLITRGAQPVKANVTDINLASSLLWGMGRAMDLEHPEWFGGLIDLDPEAPIEETSILFQSICQSDADKQVAFRDGKCYVPRLIRQPISEKPMRSFQWRLNASYLITGGLGDLGLQVARWMVQEGAKNLILLGRTKLPPASEWKQITTDSHIANKIIAIQELQKLGANVIYASVDVGNEKEISSFIQQIKQDKFPQIRGIVHLAGELRDGTILKLNKTTFAEALHPKVLGAWLLHKLFADADIDFFVLFSSAASLLGSPGQANYTAANTFLDALSHYRHAQGKSAISINWGAWAETGMAVRTKASGYFDPSILGSMTTQQGLAAFNYLLQQNLPQVGVLPINWAQWQQVYPNLSQSPLFTYVLNGRLNTTTSVLTRDTILAAKPQERLSLIETLMHQEVAKVLRILPSKLDIHLPLNQSGLDSLMALELKNNIEAALGILVPLVKFIEGNSTAQLAIETLEELMVTSKKINEKVQAEKLLAELEHLSDTEVNELLNKLVLEEEDS
ncbi:MAG: type I polyketide synthase [Nostoc sp. DedQUE08]|uniref:type I polyketide synthase n=1 Tax=Nostoc sp. DedQUE08 TaxID=3075393 RepID=UPI002AD33F97|nr:type I polyketide synthase [Nostoc sp. DedQUE08]MDZ8068510.1 type I polyketide synthase [Nostoc sp. DedQUE08]